MPQLSARASKVYIGGSKADEIDPDDLRLCIYGFFHVDKNGKPPTKMQYLAVLDALETYIKSWKQQCVDKDEVQLVHKVDTWRHTAWPEWMKVRTDLKKNFQDGKRRYLKHQEARDNAETWATALRERLDQIPPGREDEPIPWAVSEVGWTINPKQRRSNHENHHSSNQLMNFVEALAAITLIPGHYVPNPLNPQKREFRMRWQLLYQVIDRRQVELSEHIFSRLATSYSYQGGLNVEIAGLSNDGANYMTSQIWDYWQVVVNDTHAGSAEDELALEQRMVQQEWDQINLIVQTKKLEGEELPRKESARGVAAKRLAERVADLEAADETIAELTVGFLTMMRRDVNTMRSMRNVATRAKSLVQILHEVANLWGVDVEDKMDVE